MFGLLIFHHISLPMMPITSEILDIKALCLISLSGTAFSDSLRPQFFFLLLNSPCHSLPDFRVSQRIRYSSIMLKLPNIFNGCPSLSYKGSWMSFPFCRIESGVSDLRRKSALKILLNKREQFFSDYGFRNIIVASCIQGFLAVA